MEQSPTSDTLQATAEFFFEMHQYDLAADRLRSLLTSSLDPEQRLTVVAQYVIASPHAHLGTSTSFTRFLSQLSTISFYASHPSLTTTIPCSTGVWSVRMPHEMQRPSAGSRYFDLKVLSPFSSSRDSFSTNSA